jgi:hypothetical protein
VGKIWKAYSTAFIIVLGLAVGLAQEFGSSIYEGGVWFYVGMTILIATSWCTLCCLASIAFVISISMQNKRTTWKQLAFRKSLYNLNEEVM